jgi:pimeloyl-ACP methyl ester carboxylesterase
MEQTIQLPQGTIHYREDGQGDPIVFVHGLFVDGLLWRKVTPLLAGDYRCIAPDWPLGSHRTPLAPGADRSPRGIAHLIADFLDQLGLERVTIVGNDTGGAISQILASERPERLAGLVLTNCDCLENFLPPAFRPLKWLAHVPGAYAVAARTGSPAAVRRSPLGYGMLTHRPIPDAITAAWFAPLRRPEIRADMVATLKAIDKRDTLGAAAKLAEHPLPLLLAWAPDDLAFKLKFAQRLQAMVDGARLERIEDSRAFVPEDQPERLAQLIGEFVSSLAQPRGRPVAAAGSPAASPDGPGDPAQPGSDPPAAPGAQSATSQHPTSARA